MVAEHWYRAPRININQDEMLNATEDTIYQIALGHYNQRASTPLFLLSKYIKQNSDVTVYSEKVLMKHQ